DSSMADTHPNATSGPSVADTSATLADPADADPNPAYGSAEPRSAVADANGTLACAARAACAACAACADPAADPRAS
ncbi:hypothetical protein, partial [Nocardia sp. NPDC059195]|uniref:hypothetical protein n=1 Tax=Nocardia sp. NPDC059195 TaxID=3346765 RepID=UPI0036BC8FBD